MKRTGFKTLLFLFPLLTLLTEAASPQNPKSFGVMLGNPVGVNGKYMVNGTEAVDVGVGLSVGAHTNASVHSDYLFHKLDYFIFNDQYPLDFYFGLGGRMEFADDVEVGIRVPLGVIHRLVNPEADLFFEVAPILDVISRNGLELHALLGARYFFN